MAFVKHNDSQYSDQLTAEADGLALLRSVARIAAVSWAGDGPFPLHVPQLLQPPTAEKLTLERINAGRGSAAQMAALGRCLAAIHAVPQREVLSGTPAADGEAAPFYGAADSRGNYIGLNPQPNPRTQSWGQFFADARLGHQVSLLKDPGLRAEFTAALALHRAGLVQFLDSQCPAPSVVHGDLWAGNAMCDADGRRVWLIDPAAHYGDPEVDLAMSEMFGGFGPAFYDAYHAVRPRTAHYALKVRVYNLYHYLNHTNLFGASYLHGCRDGFAAVATAAAPVPS